MTTAETIAKIRLDQRLMMDPSFSYDCRCAAGFRYDKNMDWLQEQQAKGDAEAIAYFDELEAEQHAAEDAQAEMDAAEAEEQAGMDGFVEDLEAE